MRPQIFLFLLLSACDDNPQTPRSAPPSEQAIAKPACAAHAFEGSAFTVCKFDARTDRLELVWKGGSGQPMRSFAALEQDFGRKAAAVRFAMNAGMYDEEGGPVGLYIEDGKELKKLNRRKGPGNFHLSPNGVFALDSKGEVSVTESGEFRKKVRKPALATQSGPMLVINGKLHPKFDANGPSQLIRNGVGVHDPGTAYFVISEEGVSFGRFARFFRDTLNCPNALFLDGSVSSLWDPGAGRQDAYSQLGPMFVVSRPAALDGPHAEP